MSDDAPQFQWRHRDRAGWRWSAEHTTAGRCPGCSQDVPLRCPECGGRRHREPVFDDTGIGHIYYCQQERTDDNGGRPTTRALPSIAETRAAIRDQLEADSRKVRTIVAISIHAIEIGVLALFAAALAIALVYTALTG